MHQESTELVSYKDFLIGSLSGKAVMDDTLAEQILALPEGNCVCHGDFHPGNIILRTDGTAVVIDFMNACRGRWEYDVVCTYFLLKEYNENIADGLGGTPIAEIYLEHMNVCYEDIEQWFRFS